MRTVKFSVFFVVCAGLVVASGCGNELQDLRMRNASLNKRRAELESDLEATKMKLAQLQRQLDESGSLADIDKDALQQKIDMLENHLKMRNDLIAEMQKQCLGGVPLPAELNTLLEDFAASQDMVTFDPNRGIVKFRSDLLFKSGSADVLPAAADAVRSLCVILNSEKGRGFDVIIAGHTDDQPIKYTLQQHPTNWHLSAHRAISVLNIMAKSNIENTRMSVRGFGEFKPIVPNKAGQKGHPQNRRVEIYIVPKGT
jgi:chemotaxis protein MotB